MKEMQLTSKSNAFEMRFCLNCHRNPEKFVRPQTEIFDMAWTPPDDQAKLGKQLVARYHIGQPSKLTDCSICHR